MHNKAESDRRRYEATIGLAEPARRVQYDSLDQLVIYILKNRLLGRRLKVYDRHTQRVVYEGPARRFVEE